MRTGWTHETQMYIWIANGSRACEKFPRRWRRNDSPMQWKMSSLDYRTCSCTSNALQPRSPLLRDLGVMNHFFSGKELERLICSAVCDKHCLAHQAEDFSLILAADKPWRRLPPCWLKCSCLALGTRSLGLNSLCSFPSTANLPTSPLKGRVLRDVQACYLLPCGNTVLYAA